MLDKAADPIGREQIETDVVIVGAGPAGLACAIHLADLIKHHNAQSTHTELSTENIFVLEKAHALGQHTLSGAIMDPRGLKELIPNYQELNAPVDSSVSHDALFFLSSKRSFRMPIIPKALQNRGHYIVSLGRLVNWLGERAEAAGVTLLTGISGTQLLTENNKLTGIQTDDKGIDKNGKAKANFEAGFKLRARLTILAEGARGSLTKQLVSRFNLDKKCNPAAFGLGIKELWEIPGGRIKPGTVWHTFGYPLTHKTSGGGWVYAMQNGKLSLGLISGLHFADPVYDPHRALQQFKQHPLIQDLLVDGTFLQYGAKTLSQGGYWAMPVPAVDGAIIIGDGAGLVDSKRLKGIHLAIKSGMLAAKVAFDVLLDKTESRNILNNYQHRFDSSWIHKELWAARNHHQALEKGLIKGFAHLLAQKLTRGRGLHYRYHSKEAHTHFTTSLRSAQTQPIADEGVIRSKTTCVHHSGTRHERDQPIHLSITQTEICNTQCREEYGNPCQTFCPAGVFEMDKVNDHYRLKINAANCLHCKTCDILDPYQVITWQPPQGGDGPHYESM